MIALVAWKDWTFISWVYAVLPKSCGADAGIPGSKKKTCRSHVHVELNGHAVKLKRSAIFHLPQTLRRGILLILY